MTVPISDLVPECTSSPGILIVDGNCFLRARFDALERREKRKDCKPSAPELFSGIRMYLENLKDKVGAQKSIMLFDLGHSEYRIRLFPDYKGDRPEKSKELLSFLEEGRTYFKNLVRSDPMRWQAMMFDNMEADDIAAFLVSSFSVLPNLHLWLVSSDHDWLQLLKEDHVLQVRYSPGCKSNLVWNEKDADQYFGLPCRQWPKLSAFTGDGSDHIPSTGIWPRTAREWLEKYDYSLESIFEHEPEAKVREEEIRRNFELTNLNGKIAAERVSPEEAEYLLAWAEA
ncbi:MAG: hypothetical protein J6P18_00410 [Aeriscardovia sp.]|nr:hypothetical protein [Aeriscardovia sp.]